VEITTTDRTRSHLLKAQEIEAAIQRALSGIRDPEAMRRGCARMDSIREEIYQEHGTLDIGVPAIRELRDA
jgi:hypothetical protein